jgi:hypothetical protein
VKPILIAALLLAGNDRSHWFDWDRYHERQDACTEAYRLAQQCERGLEYCNELALRQAQRQCSAFGGERRDRPLPPRSR